MDDLHLSDTLQRYFSDIFLCCDDDKTGNASLLRTIELIKSANISDDIINQISEICWNGLNLTSLNQQQLTRRQFFSALKLVAAYQANMSLKPELITANIELPLPRFTWNRSENDLIELNSNRSVYMEHIDTNSTDSEVDSDTLSLARNGSPEISSTASDSPTPTNSVQDRSWAVGGAWQGIVSEEQRQLLGTEEESSDRHSSEEDTEISHEIWTINAEQREYYTNQFRSLQPDLNALLAGPVARMFFEKSRLPVHELRKIWQLADVTKDGALSLQEFNTAMHLVVLRRNHIELPDVLPTTLMPGNETPLSISPETEPILSPQTKDTAKEWTKFVDSPTSSISSPGPKPVNFDFQKISLDKDSKILHPKPLRLTPECCNTNNTNQQQTTQQQQQDDLVDSIDTHSPKKFIDHSTNSSCSSAIQRPQAKKYTLLPGPGAIPPPPSSSSSTTTSSSSQTTNNPEDGPISLPAFPPPKKDKPPPPPPRPFKTHGRSSSLDLNRLSKLGAPPTVPPRISPNIQNGKKLINQKSEGGVVSGGGGGEQFANFDNFEQYENVSEFVEFSTAGCSSSSNNNNNNNNGGGGNSGNEDLPRKHGAFEIYRKPLHRTQIKENCKSIEEKAKWELFEKLQAENRVLLRICQELSQELADVREEKLTLKLRLEKQKEQMG